MFTIPDLCTRFGLSEPAIRRRLTALQPEIAHCIHRGDKNSVLLDQNGVSILDRLNQLQSDKNLGLNSAVEVVKDELDSQNTASEHPSNTDQSEIIHEMRERLSEQQSRIQEQADLLEFLRAQINTRDDQIKAMLPSSTETRTKMSRIKALRIAILGS